MFYITSDQLYFVINFLGLLSVKPQTSVSLCSYFSELLLFLYTVGVLSELSFFIKAICGESLFLLCVTTIIA